MARGGDHRSAAFQVERILQQDKLLAAVEAECYPSLDELLAELGELLDDPNWLRKNLPRERSGVWPLASR